MRFQRSFDLEYHATHGQYSHKADLIETFKVRHLQLAAMRWGMKCVGLTPRRVSYHISRRVIGSGQSTSIVGPAEARAKALLDQEVFLLAEPSCLVEYHHLGDESFDISDVGQTTTYGERAKVLVDVARIIGLVIILRKEF